MSTENNPCPFVIVCLVSKEKELSFFRMDRPSKRSSIDLNPDLLAELNAPAHAVFVAGSKGISEVSLLNVTDDTNRLERLIGELDVPGTFHLTEEKYDALDLVKTACRVFPAELQSTRLQRFLAIHEKTVASRSARKAIYLIADELDEDIVAIEKQLVLMKEKARKVRFLAKIFNSEGI